MAEREATTFMEKINLKIHKLEIIKTKINDDYLKTTKLEDLKTKSAEAETITKEVIALWDSFNPEDYPDKNTEGFEGKKDEAITLRNTIKNALQPKIDELEAALAKAEDAGAEHEPGTSAQANLDELTEIYNRLKGLETAVTKEEIDQMEKPTLQTKRNELRSLNEDYKGKARQVDSNKLTTIQKMRFEHQQMQFQIVTEAIDNLLDNGLDKLTIDEHDKAIDTHRRKIEELLAEKAKAQKETHEAVSRALAEKAEKEAAQKERDEQAKLLEAEKEATQKERDEKAKLLMDQLTQQGLIIPKPNQSKIDEVVAEHKAAKERAERATQEAESRANQEKIEREREMVNRQLSEEKRKRRAAEDGRNALSDQLKELHRRLGELETTVKNQKEPSTLGTQRPMETNPNEPSTSGIAQKKAISDEESDEEGEPMVGSIFSKIKDEIKDDIKEVIDREESNKDRKGVAIDRAESNIGSADVPNAVVTLRLDNIKYHTFLEIQRNG